jgi:hypothetical protein
MVASRVGIRVFNWQMRWRFFLVLLAALASGEREVSAAEAKVKKVLMHFLDLKGRNSLHPSLYDRDAYQAFLRKHPREISGVRFDVEWTSDAAHRKGLLLRVELRSVHTPEGETPSGAYTTITLETRVHRGRIAPRRPLQGIRRRHRMAGDAVGRRPDGCRAKIVSLVIRLRRPRPLAPRR